MNPITIEHLETLISVSARIALFGPDPDLNDPAVVAGLLVLNRELVKVTGPIQAFSKFSNSIA